MNSAYLDAKISYHVEDIKYFMLIRYLFRLSSDLKYDKVFTLFDREKR